MRHPVDNTISLKFCIHYSVTGDLNWWELDNLLSYTRVRATHKHVVTQFHYKKI